MGPPAAGGLGSTAVDHLWLLLRFACLFLRQNRNKSNPQTKPIEATAATDMPTICAVLTLLVLAEEDGLGCDVETGAEEISGVGGDGGTKVEVEVNVVRYDVAREVEVAEGKDGVPVAVTMLVTTPVVLGLAILAGRVEVVKSDIVFSVAVIVPTVSGTAFTIPAQTP